MQKQAAQTSDSSDISIFPLNTVLLPGGSVPLRIFEPRYLDMITNCMKNNCGFGICLIKNGSEVGQAAEFHNIGTLCEISYFTSRSDGMLGITASGLQKFHVLNYQITDKQLIQASVKLLNLDETQTVPQELNMASEVLRKLIDQLGHPYINMKKKYQDASWVSSRLAELLPIPLTQKQQYLEMNEPIARLQQIWALLQELHLK